MAEVKKDLPPHGTRKRYMHKTHPCREECCREANRRYMEKWREGAGVKERERKAKAEARRLKRLQAPPRPRQLDESKPTRADQSTTTEPQPPREREDRRPSIYAPDNFVYTLTRAEYMKARGRDD